MSRDESFAHAGAFQQRFEPKHASHLPFQPPFPFRFPLTHETRLQLPTSRLPLPANHKPPIRHASHLVCHASLVVPPKRLRNLQPPFPDRRPPNNPQKNQSSPPACLLQHNPKKQNKSTPSHGPNQTTVPLSNRRSLISPPRSLTHHPTQLRPAVTSRIPCRHQPCCLKAESFSAVASARTVPPTVWT